MDDNPVRVFIAFKAGQTLDRSLKPEMFDLLSRDFTSYCSSGSPKGGCYDVQPEGEQGPRLFLQFDDLLYIA